MLVGKPKPFCSNGQSVCAASGSDPQGTRFGKAEKRRCARQADKRGTTCGFLPLVNHPLSLFSTRRTGRAAPLLRTGTAAKIVRGAEAENGSRRRYRLFPPEKWVHPVWRGCRESQHTPNSRACKIVAFTRTESASQTSVAPPPPGRARNAADATLSHRKFFHYMWNKFGCGRGQPRTSLGGGDWQEGENPPSCPPAAQANAPAARRRRNPCRGHRHTRKGTCAPPRRRRFLCFGKAHPTVGSRFLHQRQRFLCRLNSELQVLLRVRGRDKHRLELTGREIHAP